MNSNVRDGGRCRVIGQGGKSLVDDTGSVTRTPERPVLTFLILLCQGLLEGPNTPCVSIYLSGVLFTVGLLRRVTGSSSR